MTQSRTTAGKRVLMTVLAAAAACFLMMSCTAPAFAGARYGWDGQNGYVTKEETDSTGKDGDSSGTENSGSENNEGENGSDNSSDKDKSSNGSTAEQGFTTPGNGNLGDQIKSSSGKDFYTIHTKNNNTYYLVIDHANSSENVYMLSLIDEDDLAEFLKEEEGSTSGTSAAPFIIPETKPQAETSEVKEETETPVKQPAGQSFMQNNLIWILLAIGAGGFALYYFKIYKPGQEEEVDESENMETGDGLETELEE